MCKNVTYHIINKTYPIRLKIEMNIVQIFIFGVGCEAGHRRKTELTCGKNAITCQGQSRSRFRFIGA